MPGSALALFDSVQTFELPLRATGSKTEVSYAEVRGFEGGTGPLRPMYVTDANSAFAATLVTSAILKMAGEISPVAIVGLGFSVGDALNDQGAFGEWQRQRRIAYLPPGAILPMAPDVKGEADRFLEALEGEILPAVEDRFPVMRERRILRGASLGALFGLYAFFARPGLFETFGGGSPATPFFAAGLEELATSARHNHPGLSGHVHLMATDNDMEGFLAGKDRFVAHLRGLAFPNLRVTDKTVHGESHVSGGLADSHSAIRLLCSG